MTKSCSALTRNIFKSGGGGVEKLFLFIHFHMCINQASKQLVEFHSRENTPHQSRIWHGQGTGLYLLPVNPLAIQCVHLYHCRLTIDLYVFCSFFVYLSHLFIIAYCTVDFLLYKLETRAFLCSITFSEHLPEASIPYCRLTKSFHFLRLCASRE